MVLLSPTPRILLTSMQQPSQITPPLVTTLTDSRPSRLQTREPKSTSDNTEVNNMPFRLRDLRHSILKAKPCAPGPDGIHNNLLKHLPEDTLKILKEILNIIWISGDFPQWRAATVIPIPKPNHANPLSYRPIALTGCLCKVLERMIKHALSSILKNRHTGQKPVWVQEAP